MSVEGIFWKIPSFANLYEKWVSNRVWNARYLQQVEYTVILLIDKLWSLIILHKNILTVETYIASNIFRKPLCGIVSNDLLVSVATFYHIFAVNCFLFSFLLENYCKSEPRTELKDDIRTDDELTETGNVIYKDPGIMESRPDKVGCEGPKDTSAYLQLFRWHDRAQFDWLVFQSNYRNYKD